MAHWTTVDVFGDPSLVDDPYPSSDQLREPSPALLPHDLHLEFTPAGGNR